MLPALAALIPEIAGAAAAAVEGGGAVAAAGAAAEGASAAGTAAQVAQIVSGIQQAAPRKIPQEPKKDTPEYYEYLMDVAMSRNPAMDGSNPLIGKFTPRPGSWFEWNDAGGKEAYEAEQAAAAAQESAKAPSPGGAAIAQAAAAAGGGGVGRTPPPAPPPPPPPPPLPRTLAELMATGPGGGVGNGGGNAGGGGGGGGGTPGGGSPGAGGGAPGAGGGGLGGGGIPPGVIAGASQVSSFNPAGIVATWVAVETVSLAAVQAMEGFVEGLVEGNRSLARWDGGLAASFMQLDLKRQQLERESATKTGGSASALNEAFAELLEETQPLMDDLKSISNGVGIVAARAAAFIAFVMKWDPLIKALAELADMIERNTRKEGAGKDPIAKFMDAILGGGGGFNPQRPDPKPAVPRPPLPPLR